MHVFYKEKAIKSNINKIDINDKETKFINHVMQAIALKFHQSLSGLRKENLMYKAGNRPESS